jgi:multidrug resistance efflux pump
MEGQLKTLKEQKKTQEDQLEQLRLSVDSLKQGQDAAQESYMMAKNVYDRAQMLYMQYKYFLEKNPDCTTTAGLVEASIPDVNMPVEPSITSIEGGTSEADFIIDFPDTDLQSEDEGAYEKQQTAA